MWPGSVAVPELLQFSFRRFASGFCRSNSRSTTSRDPSAGSCWGVGGFWFAPLIGYLPIVQVPSTGRDNHLASSSAGVSIAVSRDQPVHATTWNKDPVSYRSSLTGLVSGSLLSLAIPFRSGSFPHRQLTSNQTARYDGRSRRQKISFSEICRNFIAAWGSIPQREIRLPYASGARRHRSPPYPFAAIPAAAVGRMG